MNGNSTSPGLTVAAAARSGPDTLQTRFPVCRRLAGDALFRSLAHAFLEVSPASSASKAPGDEFGDFIDIFLPARAMPYLGDLARLEAARARAWDAAEAPPLTVAALASLAPCAWKRTRVVLHPSVQIVTSAYPVVSIWEALAGRDGQFPIDRLAPEDALVARPDLAVEVRRLPPGCAVFLSNLSSQATFSEAAAAADASDPRFDLVTSLSVLLASRIFVGLWRPECEPPRIDD